MRANILFSVKTVSEMDVMVLSGKRSATDADEQIVWKSKKVSYKEWGGHNIFITIRQFMWRSYVIRIEELSGNETKRDLKKQHTHTS